MPIAAFATVAVLTLCAARAPSRAHRAPAASAPAPPATGRLPAGDIYSARAKRRMAAYLRMRLLELREQGLRRAVEVVEGRLTLDSLLRGP